MESWRVYTEWRAPSPFSSNLTHRGASSRFQLAAYGLDQASHLASFLLSPSAHPDVPAPTHVFSSAFYRCIETALPTAQALQALGGEVGQGRGMFLEHGAGEW